MSDEILACVIAAIGLGLIYAFVVWLSWRRQGVPVSSSEERQKAYRACVRARKAWSRFVAWCWLIGTIFIDARVRRGVGVVGVGMVFAALLNAVCNPAWLEALKIFERLLDRWISLQRGSFSSPGGG